MSAAPHPPSRPAASADPVPEPVPPAPATVLPPDEELQPLRDAEHAALLERRKRVLGATDMADPNLQNALGLPRVGLALSGGGVRSATFALGLLRGLGQNPARDPTVPRGLASNGLLGRLDYLSTVSGGGYTGAMWGRLVATYGFQEAQRLMVDSASPVLHWLRRNGRYLNPSGSRDVGIAAATYVRSWLAIHMEFMFACILLGLLVMAPHLAQHRLQLLDAWAPWGTPWWVFALGLALAAVPGLLAGYWAARDAPNDGPSNQVNPGLRELLFLLVAGSCALALMVAVWGQGWDGVVGSLRQGPGWLSAIALALGSMAAGQAAVIAWQWLSPQSHSLLVARIRRILTVGLQGVLTAVLALVALGALDWVSWQILEALLERDKHPWLWSSVGAGGVVLVVLRNLVQPLQQMAAETTKKGSDWLPRLVNLGSQCGFVLLLVGWLVVLQWFVFAPSTFAPFTEVPALLRAALLLLAFVLWTALTAGNAQMANTSSLHSFYRARLSRAYLAVGNVARRLNADGANWSDVTTVVEGDDLGLHKYAPEAEGGPIHLVNTCLNQTRDDSSRLYNADRKGTALTASGRGFEIGPERFIALKAGQDEGTLGRWVGVSGAAASPGAGSYTSRGLALLLYLLGVRLGYWMLAPKQFAVLRWGSRLAWRWMPKPLMLASEISATFFGVERPWWYLSDGGHFENTGVYALLKRELDFIILSDASCDAAYEFGDLENLVRKARIDFGAEIEFYSHAEAARMLVHESREVTVLSPEDMANNHSCRGVLLARIRYRERTGATGRKFRPEGTLLVVKPNLHDALDVDVLAYAQKHTSFPHESTSDQSFDEAQWESYHRLGEDFGRALTDDWLALLPGWSRPAHHGLVVAARLSGAKSDVARVEPLWKRGARATAIGTTLGLGASGTIALSLWQVQDQLQRQSTDERAETRQLFVKVSESLGSLDGSCPKLPEHVLTQTLDLLERRGTPALRPLDAAGVERLVEQIVGQCARPQPVVDASKPETSSCAISYQRMQTHLCAQVNKPDIQNTAMDFWHPGVSPAEQSKAMDKVVQAVLGDWNAGTVLALLDKRLATVQPSSLVTTPGVSTVPPVAGTTAAVAAAVVAAVATQPGPVTAATATAALTLDPQVVSACTRSPGNAGSSKTVLYMQVYDDASQAAAARLREVFQAVAGPSVQVAPVENVARSADLRQRRRPVAWAKPTFVLHDNASSALKEHYQDCAKALGRWVGAVWLAPGTVDAKNGVWLRDLPSRLTPTPGVIELWLPPPTTLNSSAGGGDY